MEEAESKKALFATGARQIGKTTLIREFGRPNYESFVEINFVTEKDAGPFFRQPGCGHHRHQPQHLHPQAHGDRTDAGSAGRGAGVPLPCYNVSEPKALLALNEKHSLFKLFMGDVGLLCAACMENVQFSILQGDLKINMVSIWENVIAQQTKSAGLPLHFFRAKKYGELDFVNPERPAH